MLPSRRVRRSGRSETFKQIAANGHAPVDLSKLKITPVKKQAPPPDPQDTIWAEVMTWHKTNTLPKPKHIVGNMPYDPATGITELNWMNWNEDALEEYYSKRELNAGSLADCSYMAAHAEQLDKYRKYKADAIKRGDCIDPHPPKGSQAERAVSMRTKRPYARWRNQRHLAKLREETRQMFVDPRKTHDLRPLLPGEGVPEHVKALMRKHNQEAIEADEAAAQQRTADDAEAERRRNYVSPIKKVLNTLASIATSTTKSIASPVIAAFSLSPPSTPQQTQRGDPITLYNYPKIDLDHVLDKCSQFGAFEIVSHTTKCDNWNDINAIREYELIIKYLDASVTDHAIAGLNGKVIDTKPKPLFSSPSPYDTEYSTKETNQAKHKQRYMLFAVKTENLSPAHQRADNDNLQPLELAGERIDPCSGQLMNSPEFACLESHAMRPTAAAARAACFPNVRVVEGNGRIIQKKEPKAFTAAVDGITHTGQHKRHHQQRQMSSLSPAGSPMDIDFVASNRASLRKTVYTPPKLYPQSKAHQQASRSPSSVLRAVGSGIVSVGKTVSDVWTSTSETIKAYELEHQRPQSFVTPMRYRSRRVRDQKSGRHRVSESIHNNPIYADSPLSLYPQRDRDDLYAEHAKMHDAEIEQDSWKSVFDHNTPQDAMIDLYADDDDNEPMTCLQKLGYYFFGM